MACEPAAGNAGHRNKEERKARNSEGRGSPNGAEVRTARKPGDRNDYRRKGGMVRKRVPDARAPSETPRPVPRSINDPVLKGGPVGAAAMETR